MKKIFLIIILLTASIYAEVLPDSTDLFNTGFVRQYEMEDSIDVLKALIATKLPAEDTTNIDKYNRAEVDSIVALYYKKTEIDSLLNLYYTSNQVDGFVQTINTRIDSLRAAVASNDLQIAAVESKNVEQDDTTGRHRLELDIIKGDLQSEKDSTDLHRSEINQLKSDLNAEEDSTYEHRSELELIKSGYVSKGDSSSLYYTQEQIAALLAAQHYPKSVIDSLISYLDNRVDSSNNAIALNDADISDLFTKADSLRTAINGNDIQISSLESDVNDIYSILDNQSDSLSIAYDSITVFSDSIKAFYTDIQGNIDSITAHRADIDANSLFITDMQTKNSNQSDSIATNASNIVALDARADSLVGAVGTNDTEISNVLTKNSNQSDSLSAAYDSLTSHDARINNLQSNKVSYSDSGTVFTTPTWIQNIIDYFAEDTIATHSRLDFLEADTVNTHQRLDFLESDTLNYVEWKDTSSAIATQPWVEAQNYLDLDVYPNTDTDATNDLTTTTNFSGDVSGNYNSTVVADDSHTHDTRYYTSPQVDSIRTVITDTTNALRSDINSNTVLLNTHDQTLNYITADTTNWNTAFSWGNHATQNYLDKDTDTYVIAESDPIYSGWDKSTGISITELQVSDLNHYTDADIDGSETAFDGWDKNASDDFDGSYSSLSGKPVNIDEDATDDLVKSDTTDLIATKKYVDENDSTLSETEVDNYVSNNGYLTEEVDGSTTNEIQDLSISDDTLHLSGDPTPVDLKPYLDNTDSQTLSYNPTTDEITVTGGNTIDISEVDTDTQLSEAQVDAYADNNNYLDLDTYPNADTDATDDFDGDYNSLTNKPTKIDSSVNADTSAVAKTVEWDAINNKPANLDLDSTDDYTSTDFDTDFGLKTTTNLSEGTNLYYTDTRARDAISETITGLGYVGGVFSLDPTYFLIKDYDTTGFVNWKDTLAVIATQNDVGDSIAANTISADTLNEGDYLMVSNGEFININKEQLSDTVLGNSYFGTDTANIGSNDIVVDVNGNVGIGTTAPLEKLHIDSGSILLSNTMALKGLSSLSTIQNLIEITADNDVVIKGTSGRDALPTNLIFQAGNETLIGDFIFREGQTSSERMRITSAGSVGIGTTSPDSMLTVEEGLHVKRDALIGGDFTVNGNDLFFGNGEGFDNNTDGTIDVNGNLNVIGSFVATTYPDLYTQTYLDTRFGYLEDDSTNTKDRLTALESDTSNYVEWKDTNSAIATQPWVEAQNYLDKDTDTYVETESDPVWASDSSTYLSKTDASTTYLPQSGGTITGNLTVTGNSTLGNSYFGTDTANIGSNDIVVDVNGNVGIGTTAPLEKLHIDSGSILLSNTMALKGLSSLSTIQNLIEITADNDVVIKGTSGRDALPTNLIFQAGNETLIGDFIFREGQTSSERMRITSAGSVGIGTTSPGAKLDVGGSARIGAGVSAIIDSVTFNATNDSLYIYLSNGKKAGAPLVSQ